MNMQINFGRNIKFTPKYFYEPRTETEVLAILNKHKDGKIRARGSGHAWNPGIKSEDVFLDIKYLNHVKFIKNNDGSVLAEAGAGIKLKQLIKLLHKQDLMIPAMG